MTNQYHLGLSYNSINVCRSALSAWGVKIDSEPVGAHSMIKRLMKGIYNVRTPKPKYKEIWDINVVLEYLQTFKSVKKLTLKELTLKLVILMAISTACRVDTLSKLTIKDLIEEKDYIILNLHSPLKQQRMGNRLEYVKFKAYEDKNVCVFTTLKEYLCRTKDLRSSDNLFVSLNKPHKTVTKQTISRWILCVLKSAGIDVNKYSSHSTRGASVSKAMSRNVPIDEILKTGGWKNVNTFTKFYNLPINTEFEFVKSIFKQ